MDSQYLESIITDSANSISKMERGTIIPHLVLAELLKVKPKESPYYQRVLKLKKKLEDDFHIFIRTEHKLGYYLCKPGEEIDNVAGSFMQGFGRMRKSVARTRNIILDGMKPQDQERTLQTTQSMSTIFAVTQSSIRKELPSYQKTSENQGSCQHALLNRVSSD